MSQNPFWDFSLRCYANPTVEQFCLELQEQAQANVNLLLFTLWLAAEKRVFEPVIVDRHEPFQQWRQQVVLPLRQSRCAVKKLQGRFELYEQLKKAELDVERIEQDLLFELDQQFSLVADDISPQELAEQNLQAYLQTLSIPHNKVDGFVKQLVGMVLDSA